MKKIESVELVLENIEVIKFDAEDIQTLYLNNIENSVQYSNYHNGLLEYKKPKEIHMHFLSNSNEMSKFATDFHSDDPHLPFQRLTKFNDITQVELIYNNGSSENYIVNWNDEGESSEYINSYQTSVISNNGDIFITISDSTTVEQFFKYWIGEESK